MQVRDVSGESPELARRRIAQHTLFVQIDGTNELLRYDGGHFGMVARRGWLLAARAFSTLGRYLRLHIYVYLISYYSAGTCDCTSR